MKIGESSGGSYQYPTLAKEDPVSANFRRQINEAIKEQQEAAVRTDKEDGRTIETPSLSTETMLAMIAAESTNGIVAVKEGVRMDLSHDAMQLSNTIKREEAGILNETRQ